MTRWHEILIVTGGSTPQVVTETLHAVITRQVDPIVPAKIICAVTRGVTGGFGTQFETALDELKSALGIDADWSRRSQAWFTGRTGLFIEYPYYTDGRPVDDIRTDLDAVRFGDLVSEIVQREALDPASRIHLSVAGGRKTMSFHGGAAMGLFGRPQDELSHVLVNPPEFEGCIDFWFPSTKRKIVHHRDGSALDASQAKLELAIIPFVRVRDRLPATLLHNRLDYTAHVAQTNAVLGRVPLFLELTTSERHVRIGDLVDFILPNTEFTLYQLMAEWKLQAHKGAGPRGIGQEHTGWLTARMFEHPELYRPNPVKRFLEIYAETFKTGTDRASDMSHIVIASPIDDRQRKGNESNFAQWKARLLNVLHDKLHHADLADRFGAPHLPIKVRSEIEGKRGNRVVFGLKLEPREIIIRPEGVVRE